MVNSTSNTSDSASDVDSNDVRRSNRQRLAELRLQRSVGVVHNIRAAIQALHGHASIMRRKDPKNERCEKIMKGVNRVLELADSLVGKKLSESDSASIIRGTFETLNSMLTSSEARYLRLKGESFEVNLGAAALLEALFMELILEAEDEATVSVSLSDAPATIEIAGAGKPDLSDELLETMAEVGMKVKIGKQTKVSFENQALEGKSP